MTKREKVIRLLDKCAEPDGDFGIDNAITFFHAAQADAFEQAAAMLDTMESEWYDGDQFRPNLPGDCADAIREMVKEMK